MRDPSNEADGSVARWAFDITLSIEPLDHRITAAFKTHGFTFSIQIHSKLQKEETNDYLLTAMRGKELIGRLARHETRPRGIAGGNRLPRITTFATSHNISSAQCREVCHLSRRKSCASALISIFTGASALLTPSILVALITIQLSCRSADKHHHKVLQAFHKALPRLSPADPSSKIQSKPRKRPRLQMRTTLHKDIPVYFKVLDFDLQVERDYRRVGINRSLNTAKATDRTCAFLNRILFWRCDLGNPPQDKTAYQAGNCPCNQR